MNNVRRSTIRRSILVMLILLLASSQALAVVKPTRITVKASSRTIYVGRKTTVKVKSVKPGKASKKVTYKSSNKKIATVSSKGVVTGRKAGKVTITVRSKYRSKVKAKVTITVRNKPVTKPAEPELPEVVMPENVDINEISLEDVCADILADAPRYQLIDLRSYQGYRNSYSSGHLVRAVSVPLVDSSGNELDNRACAAEIIKKCDLKSPIVIIGGSTDLERRAVQLLVSQGADNSNVFVAQGEQGSEYGKFYVTVKSAHSGMVYNAVSPPAIHADLDAETPLYRNLIDLRGTTDYNIGHLRNSVSVPLMYADTTLAPNKNRVAELVAQRGTNAIYVVICDRSEDYTDAGTTLLRSNGVPDANIVRITGGLEGYRKDFPADIEK